MRRLLSTLLLSGIVLHAIAKDEKPNYEYSVFSKYKDLKAANAAAREQTLEKIKKQFPGWGITTDKLTGAFTDVFGNSMAIPGGNAVEKSVWCMDNMLAEDGVVKAEWKQIKSVAAPHAGFVYYEQYISGHKVLFSKLHFRFTNDGKLQRIVNRQYGHPATKANPKQAAKDKLVTTLTEDIPGVSIKSAAVDADWVWFPIPAENGYVLHPAWHVSVNGKTNATPLVLDGYIDATTGKMLYRTNATKDAFGVQTKASVYKTDRLTAPTVEPMAAMLTQIESVFYTTNDNGQVNIPAITTGNGKYMMMGNWAQLIEYSTGNTPTYTQSYSGTGNIFVFPTATTYNTAYYHVSKAHDYMKSWFPMFTDMDKAIETVIDDPTNTCNAFYDPSTNSLTFLKADVECNSLAEVPDVVYHEYGHAISNNFYLWAGTSLNNGALNEACSDVWGMSITKQAMNGKAAFASVKGGGCFRRYDKMPKRYPDDIIGEVHGDGEIIAGAWWDVGVNLTNMDTMAKIFTRTYFDVPDGPNGTEGQVYHDVLISALMNDDNDANLSNGTPHFSAIVKGFAKHGIFLFGDLTISHNEITNKPAGEIINISATIFTSDNTYFTGANLNYKIRGNSWVTVPMTASGSTFSAQIPALTEGDIVDYYIATKTILGEPSGSAPAHYDPSPAMVSMVTTPYQFGAGLVAKDSNNFEGAVTGWTIGNAPGDDATTGVWIQAVPVGSAVAASGAISQTDKDHTSTTGKCLLTGNAPSATDDVGVADVDNGRTTVLSPVFNLATYDNPVIEYYRWYGNARGGGVNASADTWVAQIGNNGNASSWKYVDSTYQSDYSWRRRIFAVKDYLTSFSDVQMKFVVADVINDSNRNNSQSVVEGALDDFFIYEKKFVGIDEVAQTRAQIYPNPADGYVYIVLPQAAEGKILLYDMSGKITCEQALIKGNTRYTINTAQLVPGNYNLVIHAGKTIQSKNIAVMHK